MKKLWISIGCYCLSVLSGYAQDEKYQLFLQSGNFVPKVTQQQRLTVPAVQNHASYKIIQFDGLPTDRQKETLQNLGVTLLGYVPNNAFFASIQPHTNLSSSQLQQFSIRTIVEIQPHFKIKPTLLVEELPVWTVNQEGTVDIVVSIFEDYKGFDAEDELSKLGSILEKSVAADLFTVRIPVENLHAVAKLFFVSYVEPIEPTATAENDDAMPTQRGNVLKSNGLKYNGAGVTVSMGDTDISEESHIDFQGRLFSMSASSGQGKDHATHCGGILGGSGNYDPQYQGQAPGADILFYAGTNDYSSTNIQTNFNSYKVRVTSHSLGWTCNGGYDSGAKRLDDQAIDYDGLLHVFSAGNSGSKNCGQYPTGWGNITGGYKQGKNVLAVANTKVTDELSSSSSRGPASDGRIKPDISAVGSSVYSTQANNTYVSKSGTSMACPAVAGVLAQLIQAYRALNNGQDPQGGLLKGAILNTADDKGNVGPDFKYGWGRINALKAYNLFKEKRYEKASLSNGQSNTHSFSVPANVKEVKVMMYWMDASASSGVSKALVNDLDMQVSGAGGIYKPWQLSVSTTSTTTLNSPAQKGSDHTNNVEQVSIETPSSGTYTVNVNAYSVPQGPQEYFVLYEYVYDDITVTYPIGGEAWRGGDSEYIRWDAAENTGTFKIEYSTNNGNSWNTISSSVNGSLRHYQWSVPSTLKTDKTLIRVSRNGVSDVSDAPFIVISSPTGLGVDWVCDNAYQVSWSSVNSATSYTVYQLGEKYMDSVGTTTSTSFVLPSPANQSEYYSVSANIGNLQGRRAIAKVKNTGKTGNCPGGKDLALTDILSPSTAVCLTGGSQVTVEAQISNQGTETISNYVIKYQFDNGTIISQNGTGSLAIGQSTTVSFTQSLTLPTNGSYLLKVWVETTGDILAVNNQKELTLDLSSLAGTNLPVSEDFESMNMCSNATDCEQVVCDLSNGWQNAENTKEDDIDWRVFEGETASKDTGPTGDHTTGTGQYLYIESSSCFPDKEAILLSPCLKIQTSSQFSLWYHMLGSTMGTLEVSVVTPSKTEIVKTISGIQGSQWKQLTVDLSAYIGQTIKIQIKGVTGTDYDSDIAIDDILIEENLVNEVTFYADQQIIEVCESITFVGNGPKDVQNYTWNFGQGAQPQTATGKGPHLITYLTTGAKTVTFTGDDLTETKTNYITVSSSTKLPSIQLYSSTNGQVCGSMETVFTTSIENGGDQPVYEWYVNDDLKANDSIFITSNLQDGDKVHCTLISSLSCLSTNQKSIQSNEFEASVIEGTPYQFEITFDAYPEDISWTLSKDAVVIDQVSDYSQEIDNTTKIHDFCLSEGCYQFEINDAYKDGLLNDATYRLTNMLTNEIVGEEGADFTISATHDFCVEEVITTTFETQELLSIYPNPTQEELNVVSSENAIVYLMNIYGRVVLEAEGKKVNFDVSTISKGIYFVKIVTKSGQKVTQILVN